MKIVTATWSLLHYMVLTMPEECNGGTGPLLELISCVWLPHLEVMLTVSENMS